MSTAPRGGGEPTKVVKNDRGMHAYEPPTDELSYSYESTLLLSFMPKVKIIRIPIWARRSPHVQDGEDPAGIVLCCSPGKRERRDQQDAKSGRVFQFAPA